MRNSCNSGVQRKRGSDGGSRLEALEARRLLAATTVSIPVPAALDGGARMGDVVDTPYGFGPVWSLDITGPTFTAALPEALFLSQSRGVMEFPLTSVPAGSTIVSAQLRFHVRDFRVGFEGVLPGVDFDGYVGDGKLQVEDAFNVEDPVTLTGAHRLGTIDTAARKDYTLGLDTAFIQTLVGRGAHLGIVAHNGQGTTIDTAEGGAAAGVTPPTLVLTFAPPATPVPPPAPFPSGSISGSVFFDT